MKRKLHTLSTHLSLQAKVEQFLKHQKAILFTLFMTASTAHASHSTLAKSAGLSQKHMNTIIKKVIKHESTTGNYHAHNRSSGAYGRYQIMPKTARAYAKKLKIPYSQWKRPRNQDRIFEAIMTDNIKSLKRNGLAITAFSLYGTHQQGAGGFRAIVKNKTLSKRLERNLRQNLPKKYQHVAKANLKHTWMKYWKKKMS